MRRIICLRAEEAGGYQATYALGETLAGGSAGQFVDQITIRETATVYSDSNALIEFTNGGHRVIPWQRIISYDLEPESPGIPDSEGGL